MTTDRAIELLRGMQSSIINNGRLRSYSFTLDDSRVEAMDLAINALRKFGSGNLASEAGASGEYAQERSAMMPFVLFSFVSWRHRRAS